MEIIANRERSLSEGGLNPLAPRVEERRCSEPFNEDNTEVEVSVDDRKRIIADLNQIILYRTKRPIGTLFLKTITKFNQDFGIGTAERLYESAVRRVLNVAIHKRDGHMIEREYNQLIEDEALAFLEAVLNMGGVKAEAEKIINSPEITFRIA